VTLNLHDPVFGYVMSYTLTAKWKLVEAGTGEAIFLDQIATAGFGRAFNGITRNTVGREEGAKKNIIEGLQKINALGL